MRFVLIAVALWLTMTTTLHLANAQVGTGPYMPDVKRYSEANTCNEKLMLPITSIIAPNNATWAYMCGVSYFDSCRAEFSSRCSETNCSLSVDEYMRWVDAMSLSGAKYTCKVGLKAINSALIKGGHNCITSPGSDVIRKIITLDSYVWTAESQIVCSEMERLINEIYPPIKECDAPGLLEHIDGYFRAVILSSPCAKSIELTGSSSSITSSIFIISLFIPSLVFYLY